MKMAELVVQELRSSIICEAVSEDMLKSIELEETSNPEIMRLVLRNDYSTFSAAFERKKLKRFLTHLIANIGE